MRRLSAWLETQLFKVPQLRNMYARVGMFGMAGGGMFGGGGTGHTGEQIRGFGYLHDGSVDTLAHFLAVSLFAFNDAQRRQVEAFKVTKRFLVNLVRLVVSPSTRPGPR